MYYNDIVKKCILKILKGNLGISTTIFKTLFSF